METDACHVCDGALNGFLEIELTADISCCQTCVLPTFLARHHPLQAYPPTAPVVFLQQSDAEALGFAPCRLTLVGIYLHLPTTLHAALKFPARVWNPELLIGIDLPRIPKLTTVVTDDDLVSRLSYVFLVGYCCPRETGLIRIDTQGIRQVLHMQIPYIHLCR